MNNVNDVDNEKLKLDQEKQENLRKDVAHYRSLMNYLGCNLPTEVLCLPKEIEKILIKNGFVRVYDLIGKDLGKIKGLGKTRCEILERRLEDFFVISI